MRGVCALNFEAMQVLKPGENQMMQMTSKMSDTLNQVSDTF